MPTCPSCGDEFDTRRGLGVHHSSAHDERLPNRECAHCESEFYCEYERKYCSDDCRDDILPVVNDGVSSVGVSAMPIPRKQHSRHGGRYSGLCAVLWDDESVVTPAIRGCPTRTARAVPSA